MAEPKAWEKENLNFADEYPMDAMLAFMMMHMTHPKEKPTPFTELDPNIARMILDVLLEDSAATREDVGLVSPPSSPRQTEARRAPPAPIRPPRPALALAPGQPLPTTVRELFAGVPDGVPDA